MPKQSGTAVLVDTGPLVSIFNETDADHARCVGVLHSTIGPLLTVWPVVTEAMYLLGRWPGGQSRLWELLLSPDFQIAPLDHADCPRMRELMHQYADLPMDLADAALVRVAEREKIQTVFTLDQRDFRIYRPRHVRAFSLIPEM